ncbi:hypothetical protein [Streptomyces chartreusis]|uniref:hypothetical protein n=1 Tax=Streptomyces TaxID=1883 RepID=UPI00382DB411|nr:hypothetical protein OG938_23380 [Streptomyces chartreusis]WTA28510.1 hypothetical protein OIA45_21865 [Streptomyces chartreusis]
MQNPETAEVVQDPESVQSSSAPARRRPRARRIAAVAGTVLLLGAVVAGAGYTVVTVQDADRDAGLPTWKFPKPAAADKAEQSDKAASGLRGLLLPYDEKGYTRGPDLGEFGSDAELSGRQASELRKESLKELPRKERRQLERELDKKPIEGMAMRSYYKADGQAIYDKKAFFASVVLARLESRAAAKDVATGQNEFLSALGLFRKGPKLDGHKNAKCFLTPKGLDEKLDRVYCTGWSGDVLISVTASGVRPLDLTSIGLFVTAQLDRIDDPGKAV